MTSEAQSICFSIDVVNARELPDVPREDAKVVIMKSMRNVELRRIQFWSESSRRVRSTRSLHSSRNSRECSRRWSASSSVSTPTNSYKGAGRLCVGLVLSLAERIECHLGGFTASTASSAGFPCRPTTVVVFGKRNPTVLGTHTVSRGDIHLALCDEHSHVPQRNRVKSAEVLRRI